MSKENYIENKSIITNRYITLEKQLFQIKKNLIIKCNISYILFNLSSDILEIILKFINLICYNCKCIKQVYQFIIKNIRLNNYKVKNLCSNCYKNINKEEYIITVSKYILSINYIKNIKLNYHYNNIRFITYLSKKFNLQNDIIIKSYNTIFNLIINTRNVINNSIIEKYNINYFNSYEMNSRKYNKIQLKKEEYQVWYCFDKLVFLWFKLNERRYSMIYTNLKNNNLENNNLLSDNVINQIIIYTFTCLFKKYIYQYIYNNQNKD